MSAFQVIHTLLPKQLAKSQYKSRMEAGRGFLSLNCICQEGQISDSFPSRNSGPLMFIKPKFLEFFFREINDTNTVSLKGTGICTLQIYLHCDCHLTMASKGEVAMRETAVEIYQLSISSYNACHHLISEPKNSPEESHRSHLHKGDQADLICQCKLFFDNLN